jgi:hypothetical protein
MSSRPSVRGFLTSPSTATVHGATGFQPRATSATSYLSVENS